MAALVAVALLAVAPSHADNHDHDHAGHSHDHGHGSHPGKGMYAQAAQEAPAEETHEQHEHSADCGHDHDHAAHEHEHAGHDHGHAAPEHKHAGHDHDHDHAAHDHGHESPPVRISKRNDPTIWAKAIGSTAMISIAPVFVLYFIPIDGNDASQRNLLKVLLAFAAGGLLGDSLLHLLPHAMHPHSHGDEGDHAHAHAHDHAAHGEEGHDHSAELVIGLWVLAGIMAFLMIEMFVRGVKGGHSHGHGHAHGAAEPCCAPEPTTGHAHGAPEPEPEKSGKSKTSEDKDAAAAPAVAEGEGEIAVSGYLNLAADFAHNFTDGLAIGATWLQNERIAMITVFTIFLHEIPHEIGDFAILVQSGASKSRAMRLQFSTALGALGGCVVGLLAESEGATPAWILPFTAGGFIYIATVSVIPELLEDASPWESVKQLMAMSFGILIMVGIVFLE